MLTRCVILCIFVYVAGECSSAQKKGRSKMKLTFKDIPIDYVCYNRDYVESILDAAIPMWCFCGQKVFYEVREHNNARFGRE